MWDESGALQSVTPELLLETMAEGVMVIDATGAIRVWNPAMTQLTEYDSTEMLGQPVRRLRAPECTEGPRILALLDADRQAAPTAVSGCECRIRRKGGESIPVRINARQLRDRGGRVVGILETITDFRPVDELRREVQTLEAEIQPERTFQGMVGHSSPMLRVRELISLAAESDSTVLILGESGTGKELAAAAIHRLGPRRNQPFVRVNCGALTEELLSSELFGHVKGAFTSAFRDRIGRFEAADGGTLFLDEIGDISPAMQVKLLRVLQEGTFERVGESRTRRVDVRVVAASNRDLAEEVTRNRFREDLYYRLRVFPLHLPSLRDRRDDIPLLVRHFVDRLRARTGRLIRGVDADAMNCLAAHPWPGNIRQLENAVEYAFVVCRDEWIAPEHLPPDISSRAAGRALPHQARHIHPAQEILRSPERLAAHIHDCDGNKAEAARRLGVSRTTLWKWQTRHGNAPSPRPGAASREVQAGR